MSLSTAAATPATTATPRRDTQAGAPARRPAGPRRISGPARPARPAGQPQRVQRPAGTRAPAPAPFTQHVTRLVDHSLLDRLIRGRAWIGLIGFALIGIVAMQVTLLKLNAGIGRSIQRVTVLERQSSALEAEVAGLSAAQRVQAQATGLGMVYAPPNDVRYLHASPGDGARAATAFVPPSASSTSPPSSTSGPTATASSSSTSMSSLAARSASASPSSGSASPSGSAANTSVAPLGSSTSTGSGPTGSASTGSGPTGSASTGLGPTGSASTGSGPTGSASTGSTLAGGATGP